MSGNPKSWDETLTGGGQPWATLVMQRGPEPGKTYALNKPSLTIGRSDECEVVIDDKRVSRRHAVLRWKRRDLLIEDLNSSNGTLVNGAPIHEPTAVKDGDVIAVGPALFGLQGVVSLAGPQPSPQGQVADSTLRFPVQAKETRKNDVWLTWGSIALLTVAIVVVLAAIALIPSLFSKPPAGVPTVEIKAPHIGSQVRVGEEVIVEAVASDANGVTRVELLVNGQLVTAVKSPDSRGQTPFSVKLPWTPSKQGSHALEVRAYNAANQQNVPTSVSVQAVPIIKKTGAEGEPTAATQAAPSTGGEVSSDQPVGTITTQTDVYRKPDAGSDKLGTLSQGEQVNVTGGRSATSWWQIVYPAGSDQRGWVPGASMSIGGDVGSIPQIPDSALPQ